VRDGPVNLIAALDDERFGAAALARAHEQASQAGARLRRIDGPDDRLAAWIDFHFPATWWSAEARLGSAWVAEKDGAIAGFAAFGARGLRYPWLRPYRRRGDLGIFGPYGVAVEHRGSGIGEALLVSALCGLHGSGYREALIPAVSGERLIASYAKRSGASVADNFTEHVRRVRTTILASGAGTNARNVLERVRDGTLSLDVSAIVYNQVGAGVVEIAREHGIEAVSVMWDRKSERREAYDARLVEAVARTEPELVLLLGWMHLLSPEFLRRFPETINVHPAFLPFDPAADEVVAPDGTVIPALRGAHALRDALRAGVPWSGATVHHVTIETDRGDVLVRTPLLVGDANDEEALREKIRPVEFATVTAAIRRWCFERA
jgi:phosphoribosylglycinamide formyltransferase-1